jgi:large subunit ribosomal protein L17
LACGLEIINGRYPFIKHYARVGDLSARRLVAARLANNVIVKKLVDIVAPQYKDRKGGYTRVVKLERRPSDGSKMAAIELV